MTLNAPSPPNVDGRVRAYGGFTLIELLMVIAIIGILGALAVGLYHTYVIRGQLAQTLTDYGHIRSVVSAEAATYDRERVDLQADSVPGEVPPALAGLLGRNEFNQLGGMTLQLVKAPAGTFAGFPSQDVYALIAAVSSEAEQLRLRLLRGVLPHSQGDKLWLSPSMLYFPLDVGIGEGTALPAPPTETTPSVPPASPSPSPSPSPEKPEEPTETPASPETPATPETPETPTTPPASPSPTTPVAPTTSPATGGNASGWDNAQATRQGTGWDAQARVCIAGSDGKLLGGDLNAQVQIRVVQEVRTWDGQSTERSWLTQVPLVAGCATVSQTGSPLAEPGTEGVTGVRLEVVDVVYYWPTDPPIKWDGVTPVQRIAAPS